MIGSGHTGAGFPYIQLSEEFLVPEIEKRAKEIGYDVTFTEGYGGTIAPLADVWEATETGQLDFGLMASVFEPTKAMFLNFSNYLLFGVSDIPTADQIGRRMVEENRDWIDPYMASYNPKLFGPTGVTQSYQLISQREVKGFDDLAGHKVSAAGGNLALLENSGAAGVQSNLNEAYTNLQIGVYEA